MEVLLTCRQRTGWAGGKWTDRVLLGCAAFHAARSGGRRSTCIASEGGPGPVPAA